MILYFCPEYLMIIWSSFIGIWSNFLSMSQALSAFCCEQGLLKVRLLANKNWQILQRKKTIFLLDCISYHF